MDYPVESAGMFPAQQQKPQSCRRKTRLCLLGWLALSQRFCPNIDYGAGNAGRATCIILIREIQAFQADANGSGRGIRTIKILG
jgi:hypothetical protein